ncbi:C-X-C chemokine receptor type 5 [Microcaecilia unicolor]|uniref:C-X-C chemokine receptor type 5 n=1 Tax=Microcaecilia unicolor TaxID=1415580 RepID=A0A6P7ZUB9_9AMPH|nr:C-X-C chemokine receptor type 5 [Microcaecilia unicolor]
MKIEMPLEFDYDSFSLEAEEFNSSSNDYVCHGVTASSLDTNNIHAFQKVFIPLVYIFAFILGTVGNGLVLFVLKHYKSARTTTENYLLHLAVADLLLLFSLPFVVVETMTGWIFGLFLCRTISTIHKVNFYCSSLLLGCISVDRYLAIVHAVHTYRKRKAISIHITCLAIWLFCLLLALPYLFIVEVKTDYSNISSCTFSELNFQSNGWWQASRFMHHFVGFLIPLVVMCFCYSTIIRTLCQSHRFEKHKAVRVAIVITGVFFICWIPNNIVIFMHTLMELEVIPHCSFHQPLSIAIMVTEFIGFLHCCLNPILYAFIGVKFRNDLIQILHKLGCLSQHTLRRIIHLDRRGSGTECETATSVSTF